VDAVAEQLHQLEAEVKANLATPRTDTVAFLNQSLARLRSIPFDVEPRTRIDCLLSIVQQFHHQGQSVFSAVEPAALAVMLAEQLGDKTLLRRALNLQGIVLFSTSNPGDAIRSLARALEIAQSLGDEELQAGTWNNLAAAFYEAALYSDSRECLLQAADLALGVPKLRGLRGLALSNVALCCLHTRDYQEGIERIKDSISLMPPPTSPAEMLVRVQAEANFTRLLLATGRVREASERVIAEARARATVLKKQAHESGSRAGRIRYKEIVSKAEEEARTIVQHAHNQADELRQNGQTRMEAAIQEALGIVLALKGGGRSDES